MFDYVCFRIHFGFKKFVRLAGHKSTDRFVSFLPPFRTTLEGELLGVTLGQCERNLLHDELSSSNNAAELEAH